MRFGATCNFTPSVLMVDRRVEGVIVMWAESDHFHVENVAVRPRRHGEGLGTALLAEAERAARAARQDEIRLYTNEAMTENLDYYPRRGFVETHRVVEDGYRRVYFSRAVDPADAEL